MKTEHTDRPIGLRALPRRQIIITFVGVLMAMFLASLDQTVVGTAMPRIIASLGGFSHYTWVATAYIIFSAVTVPIAGRLTDMYGRKVFYIAGLIIFLLSSFICGFSNTMMRLIIGRGIQGIGAGIMMANAFTVIGDLFPPAERGKYMGFVTGIFGLSAIIGPTLGGFITDTLSWHWVFFVNIPFGIAVIILFILFFPQIRPDNRKHQIDFAGVITLTLSVVPGMLALSWGGVEYSWGSAQIIGMFAFSAVMLVSFILIEQRCKEPLVPFVIFKNPIVVISEAVTLFIGFGMFGSIIFVPLFFQGVLGLTATASGKFLTPMMLGVVAGSLISGQLLSRVGGHYKIQGIVGLSIMSLGMFLLSRMTIETTYGNAVVNIIITGFGLGMTMPLYVIAVQNTIPYNLLGIATTLTAFFRSLGGSLGLAVLGAIMHNRFASDLAHGLPASIKTVVPMQQIRAMVNNPQALISPEGQKHLKAMMSYLDPQGQQHLYEKFFLWSRQSLASALSNAFMFALLVLIVAFCINLFIREVPLRRQHMPADHG